jgi:hypothetical protein
VALPGVHAFLHVSRIRVNTIYPLLIWSRLPNNLYAKINTICHKFVTGKISKLKEWSE